MPKGSLQPRLRQRNGCASRKSTSGLLFVVGEERDSLGAKVANDHAPSQCRFLVNGEPTENRVALASKGTLRVEVIAQREDGAFGLSGIGGVGD